MSTLHFEDEQAEIHKLVVGPMDNNVFVLRCKQTGEAALIDPEEAPAAPIPLHAGAARYYREREILR